MQEILLYSTDFCPFCVQAKRLLENQKLAFEEVNLEGKDDLRQRLSAENGGWRTVPMIFIGSEFIGGFQELAKLHSSGELLNMVHRA